MKNINRVFFNNRFCPFVGNCKDYLNIANEERRGNYDLYHCLLGSSETFELSIYF